MSTKSAKRYAVLSHKLAALLYLTAETLQEIEPEKGIAIDLKNDCENLRPKVESVLEDLFSFKQVSGSTYLIELSNKVDTVVRKNYEQIKM